MYTIKQREVPPPLESANAPRSKNGDIKLGCVHNFFFNFLLSWELWQESPAVTYCTSIYIHLCKHNVAIIVDYRWKKYWKSILGFKLILFDRDERTEITEAHHRSPESFFSSLSRCYSLLSLPLCSRFTLSALYISVCSRRCRIMRKKQTQSKLIFLCM